MPRDIDARLRDVLAAGAQRGCFVLIVGRSSVGKTRTLYKAVRQALPDWQLVHPDPGDRDAIRLLTPAPPARTVVWLDELQRYLGVRGLTAGDVRSLVRSGQVVAATMWPEDYGFRVLPREAGGVDMHASDRELLELATVLDLSGEFTAAELSRARTLALSDERLRIALQADDGGLTQLLAAGPQLVRRWEQAPAYAKAVITAAADARRLGVAHELPGELLAGAVPGYLTAAERATAKDGWMTQALAYATTPLHGAASPLTPIARDGLMGQADGYIAADYLVQHARQTRRTACPPLTLWESCLTHLTEPDDIVALAEAAADRALLRLAEQFYRAAEGADGVGSWLSSLLLSQGRSAEAEQILRSAIERGDPAAVTSLGALLMDADRESEAEQLLRDGLAGGMPYVRRTLVILLCNQQRFEEAEFLLRDGIAAQDPDSPQRLGFLLMRELGRPGEAEDILMEAAASGQPDVAVPLAFLLADQGRYQEAEEILRAGIAAGDPQGRFRLAELLQRLQRPDEAEQACREGIALGDPMSRLGLDRLLREQGRLDEAEQTWHEGVLKGERDAPRYLAELLKDQGRIADAERVLREGIAAGHGLAFYHLTKLLEGLGRISETKQLQRYGLTIDGTTAGIPESTTSETEVRPARPEECP